MLMLSLGFLAGCESSEQKAEKHYQAALALLEKGDEDRAIVEFKNVFKLNIKHREARAAYAALQKKRGDLREAIGQYLRIADQYPDDVNALREISEMYATLGNWTEMQRYLVKGLDLAPDDQVLGALQIVYDYQQQLDGDPEALAATVAKAQALIGDMPDYIMLRQVIIDDHIKNRRFEQARDELDKALEYAPEDRTLYVVRLSVLSALGDSQAIEEQLKGMIARFPDDTASRDTLIRWYVSQGQLDDAEAYLREAVAQGGGKAEDYFSLLGFLTEMRSPQAASDELDKILAAGDAPLPLYGLRAAYRFDRGERAGAIAELKDLLDNTEPSDDARRLKIALSKMYGATGDEAAARALIDEVLAEDGANVEALKIKADWLIGDDKVGDAILALRTALEKAPRDPEILTLLARAHERNGNLDLMGEMLSLAMDAANGAPDESIRYARFLLNRGKVSTAEGILVDALRLAPDHVELLNELGAVYVAWPDWPRASQVQERLAAIGTPKAVRYANSLQNQILQGQKKTKEAVAFLEKLVAQGSAGFGAHLEIVRSYITAGEPDSARKYVAGLLEKEPDNLEYQYLAGSLDAATGDPASAEKRYRAILDKDPTLTAVRVALFRVLTQTGQKEAAAATIDAGLAAQPDDATLKWIKAGVLEVAGDLEGAIAIYEELYAADSENMVIANNLASLLSQVAGNDPAAVDRAQVIARRLRTSSFAPYQDTYGWIAFLRGDIKEALRTLEPAAEVMNEDPMVQFHLARAYDAAKQPAKALERFQRAVELAGTTDTRDFVGEARKEIERLKAVLAEKE